MNETVCDLADQKCVPCEGGVPKHNREQAQEMCKQLDDAWQLNDDASALTREFKFKGFAKTMYFVNTLAWLADREAHHPDVLFGWGYCNVTFTTHAVDGLSNNDFVCAAKLDALIS